MENIYKEINKIFKKNIQTIKIKYTIRMRINNI